MITLEDLAAFADGSKLEYADIGLDNWSDYRHSELSRYVLKNYKFRVRRSLLPLEKEDDANPILI